MLKSVGTISAISCALIIGASNFGSAEAAERPDSGPQAPQGQVVVQSQEVDEQTKTAVRDRLVSLGLTLDEANSKIGNLTTADLQKLGANPEQVAMAGIEDKTLILIAVILIAPSIILLLLLI